MLSACIEVPGRRLERENIRGVFVFMPEKGIVQTHGYHRLDQKIPVASKWIQGCQLDHESKF
jgi:hypothetical protein